MPHPPSADPSDRPVSVQWDPLPPATERDIPGPAESASAPAHGARCHDPAARTFLILAIAACGMASLLALVVAAGHDQMWCLYVANLVRHGTRLYGPEVFESNPPLILWISVVPAALAGWVHLPATAIGKLLIILLAAATGSICLRMLRALHPTLAPAALAWLGFVFVVVSGVIPARDFGQRDHILALACLPYILSAALALEGRPLSRPMGLLVGIAAGIGIALKPHEALIPISVEATVLALSRTRRTAGSAFRMRPEPLAILGCGSLYVIAIRWLTPDYITRMLPALRETYWAVGHLGWPGLVAEAAQLHILAVLTLALYFWIGRRPVPPLVTLLLAAGIAATLAYYLQGTGWYYQQLPALTFFTLAFALLAIDAAARLRFTMPRWAPNAALAFSLLALALTTHFSGYPFTPDRSFPIDTPDPTFFAGLAPGTPVATITTTVDYTVPPVFKYHLTLAQRYPHLWMLPAILRMESGEHPIPPNQLAALEHLQRQAMVEDLQRWQPRLILVERCQDPTIHCQVLEDRHDDLLAWFLRDPAFRELFSHYHYLRTAGRFDGYVPN